MLKALATFPRPRGPGDPRRRQPGRRPDRFGLRRRHPPNLGQPGPRAAFHRPGRQSCLRGRLQPQRHAPGSQRPLRRCVESSRAQVEHQIWLLRPVLWWYLLPIALPMLAFFGQVAWQARPGGVGTALAAFGVLVAWGGIILAGIESLFLKVSEPPNGGGGQEPGAVAPGSVPAPPLGRAPRGRPSPLSPLRGCGKKGGARLSAVDQGLTPLAIDHRPSGALGTVATVTGVATDLGYGSCTHEPCPNPGDSHWLNPYAVRSSLEPRRQELETLLMSLEDETPAAS